MSEVCKHERFKHELKLRWLEVSGLGGGGEKLRQLFLLIRITCSLCGRSFTFRGDQGASTFCPSTSPDGLELRAPMDWPEEPELPVAEEEPHTVH